MRPSRSPGGTLWWGSIPAHMTIRKVWIEDACISCNLCEDLVPEVFEVEGAELVEASSGNTGIALAMVHGRGSAE